MDSRLGASKSVAATLLFLAVSSHKAEATIHFIQISPVAPDAYTVTKQFEDIKTAINATLLDFKERVQGCELAPEVVLRTGTETDLFNTVKTIAAKSSNRDVIVGFSRSTWSLIAARASTGTPALGLSIGAASNELQKLNPRFFSVAAPWTSQWALIQSSIQQNGCDETSTLGVFNSEDAYSRYFKSGYTKSFSRTLELSSIGDQLKENIRLRKVRCLVLGMNISVSEPLLSELKQAGFSGYVYGVGDWTYFSGDFRTFLKRAKPSFNIFAPRLFDLQESDRLKAWVTRFFKKGGAVDPLLVYLHDALFLAGLHACGKVSLRVGEHYNFSKLGLLRKYGRVLPSGNLDAPIILERFE